MWQFVEDHLIEPVITCIAAIGGWFMSRKRYKSELERLKVEVSQAEQAVEQAKAQVDATELDNVEKTLGIYRTMVEDLGKRVEEVTQKMNELARRNDELLRENIDLRIRINNMQKEIEILKRRNENTH